MDCVANIEKLAMAKFDEAECLYKSGHFDWAYYTAGYTIELLLKAKVCRTLGIEDFFDENSGFMKKLKYPQTFKIHNLEQLLLLSGVYTLLDKELTADANFKAKWSKICVWTEESRYLMGKTPNEVGDFLTSIKDIAKWIQGK
jgi:hypothetical protein